MANQSVNTEGHTWQFWTFATRLLPRAESLEDKFFHRYTKLQVFAKILESLTWDCKRKISFFLSVYWTLEISNNETFDLAVN